ncbi:MAG: hypothetical protein ABJA60_08340 [Nitrosospira sp.]
MYTELILDPLAGLPLDHAWTTWHECHWDSETISPPSGMPTLLLPKKGEFAILEKYAGKVVWFEEGQARFFRKERRDIETGTCHS